MTSSTANPASRNARAEAAAWVARLRSEDRTAKDERGFRAWLAEDVRHQEAFETVTAIFELSGAADPARFGLQPRAPQQTTRRHFLSYGVSAAAALVLGVGVYLRSGTTYATEVGEQRKVSLPDGTYVSLDTDTEIRVAMDDDRRVVRLNRGRAHFDVAEDPRRPFEVIAGDKSVVTQRAHFDVTRDGVVVTVLSERGPVSIAGVEGRTAVPGRAIEPGQRLVFAADTVVREDRPVLAQATAWRHGRLAFFEDPLSAAVAEMNRYTRRPIVIVDPELAQMPISGNYSVGDTEAFATSVAVLLPVRVELERNQVTLKRSAHAPKPTSGS